MPSRVKACVISPAVCRVDRATPASISARTAPKPRASMLRIFIYSSFMDILV